MRKAYELAFSTAYVFCGKKPEVIYSLKGFLILLGHWHR